MIALIGFTGAGKSTLGKLAARNFGIPCYDNDEFVEKEEGLSIRDIFQNYGEEYFREAEARSIARILEQHAIGVLVTGGGAPLSPMTRQRLLERAFVVHVSASMDDIITRLENDGVRPLAQGGNQERLTQLFRDRAHLYDFAHVVLKTDDVQRASAELMAKWMRFM